ncbi:GNAT family N-acetyltransferase [Bacillus manliponensis]|uniref:GNAT family N-acetyltransferase n=1 Tax=Bacillus manliponensis TaxID=574376 RepID=UPI003516FA81
MNIRLIKATESDATAIFDMQKIAFLPLLETYKDYDTNPANEQIDRVISRIHRPNGGFYKIIFDDLLVGAIGIYAVEKTQFWISPMFILPHYQGKGIAQKAICLAEEIFPEATSWELKTLLEEKRNCYLYEKMGYEQIGERTKLNEDATLVHYEKKLSN